MKKALLSLCLTFSFCAAKTDLWAQQQPLPAGRVTVTDFSPKKGRVGQFITFQVQAENFQEVPLNKLLVFLGSVDGIGRYQQVSPDVDRNSILRASEKGSDHFKVKTEF